jgi:hypothetical protein
VTRTSPLDRANHALAKIVGIRFGHPGRPPTRPRRGIRFSLIRESPSDSAYPGTALVAATRHYSDLSLTRCDAALLLITFNVNLPGSKTHLAHGPGLTRVELSVVHGSLTKRTFSNRSAIGSPVRGIPTPEAERAIRHPSVVRSSPSYPGLSGRPRV